MAFIFDTSKGETPESIARMRELAKILGSARRVPQNVGEGLVALGDGIVSGILDRRAGKAERAGVEDFWNTHGPSLQGIAALLGSGDTTPDSSVPMPGEVDLSDLTGNDVFTTFMDTVREGGLTNPYALAAVAATGKHESAFAPGNVARTWNDPSESGKPGRAGGVMSWRGPRYEALAATGDLSPAGQAKFFLREDPNLIAALNNAKSVEEAQQLMNRAWAFAGYDKPGGEAARRLATAQSFYKRFADGGLTGAPAQVASLGPNAGIAATEAMVGGQPMPPVSGDFRWPQDALHPQTARPAPLPLLDDVFDARAGGPPVNPPGPMGGVPVANNEAEIQALEAQMMAQDPAAFAGPTDAMATGALPMPVDGLAGKQPRLTTQMPGGPAATAAFAPEPFNAQPPLPTLPGGEYAVGMVQPGGRGGTASIDGAPQISGLPAPAVPAPAAPPAAAAPPVQTAQAMPQRSGPTLEQLLAASAHPHIPEHMRNLVNLLIQQRVQEADPVRQMQLEKGRLELELMRNPRLSPSDQLARERFNWDREQAGRTSDINEYEYAKQQGYTGSFADFQREMKQAGAASTNVTLAGEKAWDTESAKLWAKRYDDLGAGAMNAESMLGMYDLAEQALNSGVRTGIGGEAELTLRQLGAALGMDTDPEKLASGELIRSVQNRMALLMRSPDGGMGMPGALSDRDIKFLKDSQIGIDRSPEGNRKMLEAYRLMERRKVEIARLADDYVEANGRLDAGFNRVVRDFARDNPLFPEAQPNVNDAPPAGVDPDLWQFMTPEERRLFQ